MKIAIFHNLPSGGGKRLLSSLTTELFERENKIDIYSYPERQKPLFRIPKFSEYKEIPWLLPKNTKEYLAYILLDKYIDLSKKLAEYIDGKNYDFVILGGDWITQTSVLSNFLSTPTVHIAHELKRNFYEKTRWGIIGSIKQNIWNLLVKKIKKLEISGLNSGKLIVTNSIFSARQFEKVISNKKKIATIYPFIDYKFFREKLIKKGNFFLSVGTLSTLKGYDFLIRTLGLIPHAARPPLIIVGTKESYSKEIEKISKNLEINLTIKNNINDTELINLYRQAKAFFFFPINEPFGLSPIEALILRCRSFTINEGGFTEIASFSKNCSLLPRNEKIVSETLISYIKNPKTVEDNKFINMIKNEYNVSCYADKLLAIIGK